MVTAKRKCDLDESMLSSTSEDCLRDLPNIKKIRKEQKTCLLNLALEKDVFAIPLTVSAKVWFF